MFSFLLDFLHMGGYGFYIWSAYGCVFIFLFMQWIFPWRRWKRYLREQSTKS
ncbi:MAG: heme exporter protein CcmD [Gammaproteobacteria bacterium]|nr:heme exporter protein CcmD [Gammaproteobacteria bacterium]MCW5582331.1 heme exporter protein CcmD [Gammaproteobacteria bacterium]